MYINIAHVKAAAGMQITCIYTIGWNTSHLCILYGSETISKVCIWNFVMPSTKGRERMWLCLHFLSVQIQCEDLIINKVLYDIRLNLVIV